MKNDETAERGPGFDTIIWNVAACVSVEGGEQYQIMEGMSIGITDGLIQSVTVMPRKPESANVIDGTGLICFPGLISTHNHLFQNLCKQLGDELTVWPIVEGVILATAEEMTPEDVYLASLAACLEGLQSGRTTLLDFMVGVPSRDHHRAVMRALRDSGVRGIIGRATRELHHEGSHRDPWYQPIDVVLEELTQLSEEYSNGLGVPSVVPAPGNPRTMTTKGLQLVAEYCLERDCIVTTHLAEYAEERNQGLERWGVSTIAKLAEIGFLSERCVAAHCVYLNDAEIDVLASTNTHVSYNPVSNAYCGIPTARVVDMLERGIRVSLAVDGSSVNGQSMLESLKFGALMQKTLYKDAMAVNARDMLNMATAAAAVGLRVQNRIGDLAPGKQADLFLFDPKHLNSAPLFDPISSLVYHSDPRNIHTVMIGGEVVMRQGLSTKVDQAALIEELSSSAQNVSRRAGTHRYIRGRRRTPFGIYESVGAARKNTPRECCG